MGKEDEAEVARLEAAVEAAEKELAPLQARLAPLQAQVAVLEAAVEDAGGPPPEAAARQGGAAAAGAHADAPGCSPPRHLPCAPYHLLGFISIRDTRLSRSQG